MRHITWMILVVWFFAWGAGVANACVLHTPAESAQTSFSAANYGGSVVHGHQKNPSDSSTGGCLKFCDEPRLVITKLDQTIGDGGAVVLGTLNRAMAPGAASASAIQLPGAQPPIRAHGLAHCCASPPPDDLGRIAGNRDLRSCVLAGPGGPALSEPTHRDAVTGGIRIHSQDTTMKKLVTLIALSTTAFLTACANPTPPGAGTLPAADAGAHAGHHPATAAAPAAPAPSAPAAASTMKNMQAMRDKMMSAKTPAERQALMDEHMKSMDEGMAMMKGMGNMQGMQGMGSMKNMPMMDMAKHHQMMEMRMEMMQTMMEMMMQRMPGAATPPAGR